MTAEENAVTATDDTDVVTAALKEQSALGELPAKAIEELAVSATVVRVSRGEWLFRAGEPADAFYIVDTGSFEVLDHSDGDERILRTLSRGAVVGELATLAQSPRSASVRARRDATVVRIEATALQADLLDDGQLSRAVIRSLATQLQASVPRRPGRSERQPVIAVVPGSDGAPSMQVAAALAKLLGERGNVSELKPQDSDGNPEPGRQVAQLVARAERSSDVVLLTAAAPVNADAADGAEWTHSCIREADRIVVVARADDATIAPIDGRHVVDLLVAGGRPPLPRLHEWLDELSPKSHWYADREPTTSQLAPLARSLAGRSVALVLSGGGARGFAHVGLLQELDAAGIVVDRYAGTSMGAYVGALGAFGLEPSEIHERLRQNFTERNPLGDFTLPLIALSRGMRGRAIVDGSFGDLEIEQLPHPFFCLTVDLVAGESVVHDRGWLAGAVGASMSIPGLVPPFPLGDRRLVDGGLLSNLPVDHMIDRADGPVVACDVFAGFAASARGAPSPSSPWPASGVADFVARLPNLRPEGLKRRVRRALTGWEEPLPSLPEVLGRIATLPGRLSSEANGQLADVLIQPQVSDVGIFEFARIDEAVERGRVAGRKAIDDSGHLLGAR